MPLYSLKVQRLVVRWELFHSSSSTIFMDDTFPQWVLYCVCVDTRRAMEQWGWEILEQPTYSSDLAPSDFHRFPNMKKHLPAKRFKPHDDIKHEVQTWLCGQDPNFYRQVLMYGLPA